MRVAILDDYQEVALASADWSGVRELGEITVFTEHIARTEPHFTQRPPHHAQV